jgi:hypothetical protein
MRVNNLGAYATGLWEERLAQAETALAAADARAARLQGQRRLDAERRARLWSAQRASILKTLGRDVDIAQGCAESRA